MHKICVYFFIKHSVDFLQTIQNDNTRPNNKRQQTTTNDNKRQTKTQ